MTDQEKLDDLNKQIDSLTKQKEEITDTLAKSELSKNRFRFLDLGDYKYWIKVLNIGADMCTTLELYEDYGEPLTKIQKCQESFNWLVCSIPIVEEIFNSKYKEFLDKLKL